MLKVKYTPKGVFVVNEANNLYVAVYDDPQELQKLIDKLQEAKMSLVEHLARSAEEGQQQLWEQV